MGEEFFYEGLLDFLDADGLLFLDGDGFLEGVGKADNGGCVFGAGAHAKLLAAAV